MLRNSRALFARPSKNKGGLVRAVLAPQGGVLLGAVRPYLPVVLQYGPGWAVIYWSCIGALTFGFAQLGLFLNPSAAEEVQLREAQAEADYVIVFDDKGRPASYAYKPLAESANRVKERSRRLRDGEL